MSLQVPQSSPEELPHESTVLVFALIIFLQFRWFMGIDPDATYKQSFFS